MIKKSFLKRIAFAILFFIPNFCFSWLPPGKMTGFNFSRCQSSNCYLFRGSIGYTSKMNSIFSSENTVLQISSTHSDGNKQFFCDEFTYNLLQEIMTCTDLPRSQMIELNLIKNKLSTFNLL